MPFYLPDGMLPNSWIIEQNQSDLQMYSVELYFFNKLVAIVGSEANF